VCRALSLSPSSGETVGVNLEALAAHPLVGLLALIGGAALLYRVGRGVLRLGLAAAETAAVSGLVEVSIRHGDLTGLAERKAAARLIRRTRVRAGLFLLLWLALLVVPLVAGVARLVYAACALVWLLPREPIRLTPSPKAASLGEAPSSARDQADSLPTFPSNRPGERA
jgi:hypothetical protein